MVIFRNLDIKMKHRERKAGQPRTAIDVQIFKMESIELMEDLIDSKKQ